MFISCCFDSEHPRWRRTPLPRTNSVVQFLGKCRDFSGPASRVIDIDVAVFNFLNIAGGVAPAQVV
jgi:hypothetical protein